MYDIDHLYLARYNYRMDKNGKLSNWMEKGSKKYYQNKLLGNMLTLLTDKDSINTTYKSIDSDVELPRGCSEKVLINESFESEPYNFGTLRALVSVKNDFISGKISIGPFALNSTSHMLTSHYDVKFRPTVVTENTKIKGFKQLLDDDGNFISAWLSGYISGSVDNAKDPFLAKLNTNQFTYNMLNLLLRNGFGETAVWFCAQPIVRDMSAASEKAKSQFSKDNSNKGSGLSRKEFAIMQAVKKYVPESSLTAQALKKWTTSTQTHDLWDRVRAINWVEENRDLLREFATNPSLLNITINGVDYSREYVQLKVFFAWKSLEKYATALGGLVQHTKIDTRKHGKTLIDINRYLDEYNKIFDPDEPNKSIWNVNGLKDFVRRTWIDQKTKAAISLPSFILQNYTFSANPRFINAVLAFGHMITEPGEQISSTVINKISRHMQTAVKSKYFVDYVNENLVAKDKDGNPTETASDHIKNLFIGPKSMSKRLTGLKLAIELNPNYKRLANNGLIRLLYSLTEEDKSLLNGELTEHPGFITVLDNVDSSRINSDLLTDGWEDLLNDSDEHVRRFAHDLIIYAFMSSGEFKGWSKLFKYVPASWITGESSLSDTSYSDYIENVLSSNYDYTLYFDEIASNCFGDRTIVEQIPMKNADDQPNFIDQNNICKIGRLIDVTEIESLNPYILVKQDSEGRNTDAYNLYKLVGFKHDTEDTVYPVYIRMKKKGYSKKSNNVYEYGWDMWYPGNEKRTMKGFDVASAIRSIERMSPYDMDEFNAAQFKLAYGQGAKPHAEEAPTISNKPEQADILNSSLQLLEQKEENVPNVDTFDSPILRESDKNNNPDRFYIGNIIPDVSTVFVFGSNPEGRHGAGAAATAKSQFGAIRGQGEGLLGNSYAIPTKDLLKAKGTDWYRPGEKEERNVKLWYNPPKPTEKGTVPNGYTEAEIDGLPALKFKKGVSPRHADRYYYKKDGKYYERFETMDAEENWIWKDEERSEGQIPDKVNYFFEGESENEHYFRIMGPLSRIFGSYGSKDYSGHNYSEVYNHPLNRYRSIQPLQIVESIKKMYEVARLNPDKQFKVSNYPFGKISLSGYIGEEMAQMFIDAGPIPNNIIFPELWKSMIEPHLNNRSNEHEQC